MRKGISCTVSGIIHHQCTIGHLLLDEPCHIGVGITRRRGDTVISVPVDLLYVIARIGILHKFGHTVSRSHMRIVVAVVAHHTNSILPGTRIFVVSITDGLVYQNLGLFKSTGRETSHCHIGLAKIQSAACTLFYLFSVVEQAVEIVAYIAVDMTERVFTFETEQKVVKIAVVPF